MEIEPFKELLDEKFKNVYSALASIKEDHDMLIEDHSTLSTLNTREAKHNLEMLRRIDSLDTKLSTTLKTQGDDILILKTEKKTTNDNVARAMSTLPLVGMIWGVVKTMLTSKVAQ